MKGGMGKISHILISGIAWMSNPLKNSVGTGYRVCKDNAHRRKGKYIHINLEFQNDWWGG